MAAEHGIEPAADQERQQTRAEARYSVRAARNHEAAEMYEHVQNVARGTALMTDTDLRSII